MPRPRQAVRFESGSRAPGRRLRRRRQQPGRGRATAAGCLPLGAAAAAAPKPGPGRGPPGAALRGPAAAAAGRSGDPPGSRSPEAPPEQVFARRQNNRQKSASIFRLRAGRHFPCRAASGPGGGVSSTSHSQGTPLLPGRAERPGYRGRSRAGPSSAFVSRGAGARQRPGAVAALSRTATSCPSRRPGSPRPRRGCSDPPAGGSESFSPAPPAVAGTGGPGGLLFWPADAAPPERPPVPPRSRAPPSPPVPTPPHPRRAP